ncbi:MAG: autotransporter domain-containing protein [Rhizobiales bacterium]|nr:autotransporter domain-containing protein [Hyphomicrobiales bacterium]
MKLRLFASLAVASLTALGLRAGIAHTWHDIRTTRIVNFPAFNDMLRANTVDRTTQVFGDLGCKVRLGVLALEPFASLA